MSDDPTGSVPEEGTPVHDAALDAMLAQWAAAPDSVDVEGALARVTARRRAESVTTSAPATDDLAVRRAARHDAGRVVPLWQRTAFRVAAALIIVAGATAVWRSSSPPERAVTYATTTGMSQEIRLADGTAVRLGPASSLELAPGFGRTHRHLTLHGEAWFEVTHDDAMPFAVKVGAATVEDVGTAFLVRESLSREVSVRVTEGIVTLTTPVATKDTTVTLRAGDGAVATPAGIAVAAGAVSATEGAALASGHLTFADASLTEVQDALRRWYGVTLVMSDSALAARRVTADFTSEPVSRVAAVLGLTLGVMAETRGDTIELRTAGTPPRP
jgi:transmembrane sensor